jgi:hypothetical protein
LDQFSIGFMLNQTPFMAGDTVVIRVTDEADRTISEETVVLSQFPSPLRHITSIVEGKGNGTPSFLQCHNTDNGYLLIVTF